MCRTVPNRPHLHWAEASPAADGSSFSSLQIVLPLLTHPSEAAVTHYESACGWTRLSPELHLRLRKQLVSFSEIARLARADKVLPRAHSALGLWYYVIDGISRGAAVLARIVVAPLNHLATCPSLTIWNKDLLFHLDVR